jgi:Uma2 family endonuclease
VEAAAEQALVTAADFARLPEGNGRYELVRGELVPMVPPGGEHGKLATGIVLALGSYVRTNDLGEVLVETGYYLSRDPDTVRAPDVSFIRRDRIPAAGIPRGFIDGPPDLAIEIVSPGDRAEEIDDKIHDYLTSGTRLVWLIQPRTRSVTVFRPDGTARLLQAGGMLDGEAIVPGFTLPVEQLWR